MAIISSILIGISSCERKKGTSTRIDQSNSTRNFILSYKNVFYLVIFNWHKFQLAALIVSYFVGDGVSTEFDSRIVLYTPELQNSQRKAHASVHRDEAGNTVESEKKIAVKRN